MDNYEPIRVIGEGSFGKVYLMRQRRERRLVCVKVVKVKNIPRKERESCKLEVDLLRRLHHPNIVGYVESFMHQSKECLCIVMQYCDGGDLCAVIKDFKEGGGDGSVKQGGVGDRSAKLFPESKVLHWFVQMALGLQYMHQERVLHRDLKVTQLLVGRGRSTLSHDPVANYVPCSCPIKLRS